GPATQSAPKKRPRPSLTVTRCSIRARADSCLPPILQKNAGYDPLASYDPIVLVAQSSNLMVVHPSLPVNSVQELVAYAKANPGKVNFSSGGIGVLPHLIGEWFKSAASIDIVHVPYRGGGPSINDLLAGQVQMTFEGTSVLLPLIRSATETPVDAGERRKAPKSLVNGA